MRDLLLFHWSPTERRRRIIRYGLLPSSPSTTNPCEGWVAPYICFGVSPAWAWALSAAFSPHIESWDLWQVWRADLPRNKAVWDEGRIKEVRSFERVYKRHLWYVGSRLQRGERS